MYIYIYVCLSVCLSGCLAVWLSGCLAGCLSVCTYVCMHVCITVCKYINIEKRHVRVCMYIYIHIHRIVSHQIHIYKSTHICWVTPSISITAARLAGRRQLHWQLRRDPPHEAVGDATQNTRTIARVLVKRPWNSQSSGGCLGIHGGTQGDIYIYIYSIIYIYIYICIHGYIMIHIHILYMVNNMINAVNLQNRKPSKNTRWEWRFIGFTSSPCGVLAIENHHILLMNFHMFTYYSQPKLRIFQLTLNKLSKPNTKPSPKSSFYGWYKPSKYGWCIVALLTFIQILLINPIMNHPQNHHGWIVSTIPK